LPVRLDIGSARDIHFTIISGFINGAFMEKESRRNFLVASLGGIAALAAGAIIYPIYRYLAPVKDTEKGAKVSFAETDVPPGGAKFFQFRGETGVVVRKRGGEYVALSAVCTHLGCIVQWQNDRQDFLCPCHAGRYSAEGKVVSGPPPKPLARLPVIVDKGIITVG
jgi:cytochrome b6-f complex iron-sulfur subunit